MPCCSEVQSMHLQGDFELIACAADLATRTVVSQVLRKMPGRRALRHLRASPRRCPLAAAQWSLWQTCCMMPCVACACVHVSVAGGQHCSTPPRLVCVHQCTGTIARGAGEKALNARALWLHQTSAKCPLGSRPMTSDHLLFWWTPFPRLGNLVAWWCTYWSNLDCIYRAAAAAAAASAYFEGRVAGGGGRERRGGRGYGGGQAPVGGRAKGGRHLR